MSNAAADGTMQPIYDPEPLAQLGEMLGSEMVVDLIDEFERSGLEIIDKLTVALATGDTPVCQREVHGLKSASASLGLLRLAALCLGMELDCRDGNLSRGPEQLESIRENYRTGLAALQYLKTL